jgi:predicted DNA-binding protein with PD1-like motif
MATLKETRPVATFMGRLAHDADLLDEITRFCLEKDIRLGRIEALGAVKKARLGFYDQTTRTYDFLEFDKPLEITNLIGNISIKDGKPFPHVHVTLSDHSGQAVGGHLAPGTIVFACEIVIQAFEGPLFERGFDEDTGLPLWDLGK